MPRHRPPFRESRPYFNFDARAWIATNRQGWTTAQINTTLETIWVGLPTTRTRYIMYKMNHPNAPNSPGLPTPNPIPVHPYTVANLAASRMSGLVPGVVALGGVQAAAPAPAPAPPPPPPPPPPPLAAPQTLVLGPIQSLALTPGSLPQQSNPTFPFDFWPPLPWPAEPETENWALYHDINNQNIYIQQEGIEKFLHSFGQGNPHAGPDENNWYGLRFLGAGAFGSAGLWVHTDENRNILRRQVIKDVEPEPRYWRDPAQWRDHLPREIRIHQLVDRHRRHRSGKNDPRKHDRKYLIKHYGHSLKMRSRRYRIYLKYYAGGDLGNAIEWTRHADGESEPAEIPEGFIWHVIESLVKACKVLQTGVIDPKTLADEDKGLFKDWKPITHLDIQLQNIFVVEAGDQQEPRPQLVLSDFGQAFYSLSPPPGATSSPSDNPWAYQIEAAIPAWAPEHQENVVNPPEPLGEKTDVWLIGSTAWMLMAGNPAIQDENGPFGPQREDNGTIAPVSGFPAPPDVLRDSSIFPAGTIYTRAAGYSQALKSLVVECLQWDVEDRIDLQWLEDRVDEFKEGSMNAGILNDMRPPPFRQSHDFWPKRGVLAQVSVL